MTSEYRTRLRPANTYLVRERDRSRVRELAFLLLSVLLLGGALLAWTSMQLELRAVGGRVLQREQQLQNLERTERELQLEAAFLASPPRIDRRAREELGMAPPLTHRIVHLARP